VNYLTAISKEPQEEEMAIMEMEEEEALACQDGCN
jgi:hypothetical protein